MAKLPTPDGRGAGAVAYLAVQLAATRVSGRAATNRQGRSAAAAVAYMALVLALLFISP